VEWGPSGPSYRPQHEGAIAMTEGIQMLSRRTPVRIHLPYLTFTLDQKPTLSSSVMAQDKYNKIVEVLSRQSDSQPRSK
jgi:hypothetical protein